MTGAKLSTVNVTTGRIRGVQVDAFNYAEEGEFQLCLISPRSLSDWFHGAIDGVLGRSP